MAMVTAAQRAAPITSAAVHDLTAQCVVLLDHDTAWGRDFRTHLMSWGVDVVIGPHAPETAAGSVLVMGADAFSSDVMRKRLRMARAVLPDAQLVLVTTCDTRSRPEIFWETDDLTGVLHARGIGFVGDANT